MVPSEVSEAHWLCAVLGIFGKLQESC